MRNLLLAFAMSLLCLAATGTAAPSPPVYPKDIELNISHASKKGSLLRLWQQIECPQKDWFRGSLDVYPSQGLLMTPNGTVITDDNKATFANHLAEVVYKPRGIAPGTKMPVSDRFTLAGVPVDMCNANKLEGGPLNVNVKITNARPVSFSRTYTMFQGSPRSIYFRWNDADGLSDVTDLNILGVSGGCTLARFPESAASNTKPGNLTEILTYPVKIPVPHSLTGRIVWRYHLQFEIRPPQANIAQWIKGDPATQHCEVNYTITDYHGLTSDLGQVKVAAYSSDNRYMHAYNGEYTARPGRDGFITISLRTSAEGGLKGRHFYIDELPSQGKLFVRGLGGTFDNYQPHEINTSGLVDSLGRQRRSTVRLYYMPPKETHKGQDAAVFVKWHFTIGATEGTPAAPKPEVKTSSQATITINLVAAANQTGPVCGITTLDPVFHERPFIKIPWNYSLPDGSEVSRIVLYSLPKHPLGDFYATENSAQMPADSDYGAKGGKVRPLVLGNFFNDRKQQTFFKMREASTFPGGRYPPLGIQQWFRIRVMNYKRQSCIGLVRVIFRKHDEMDTPDVNKTISSATTGTAIRNEVALVGKFNLLPLRGLANRSLADHEKVRGIRIVSLPTMGKLYSLVNGSPLLTKMYGTYCRKVDCSKLKNSPELQLGAELTRTTFDGVDQFGVELLRVLYRSNDHLTSQQMDDGDSFSYRFIGTVNNTESTWLQRVYIYFRKGYNKVLYFSYDKPKMVSAESDGKAPAAHAQQVYANLKISNMSAIANGQAVEVMPQDEFKHHAVKKKKFHLFQLKSMDGHRAVPGAEIAPSVKAWDSTNTPRQWVSDPENRLVFAPSLSTHRQRFSFRVRIYPLSETGVIADMDKYTEYRVRVTRHNNPPKWDMEEPCMPSSRVNCFSRKNNTVAAGQDFNMFFSVVDLDDDAITFTVPKIPKFGRLDYVSEKPTGVVRRGVRAGTKIRLGKSTTPFKGLVAMIYRHVYNTARYDQYPLTDKFTIYGSDGGDKTPLKEVELTIVNDGSRGKKKDDRQKRVRDSVAVGVAVLVMLCAIVVAAAVIVKRRHSLKRRYMALPVVASGGQPQAGSGPAREMSSVASA